MNPTDTASKPKVTSAKVPTNISGTGRQPVATTTTSSLTEAAPKPSPQIEQPHASNDDDLPADVLAAIYAEDFDAFDAQKFANDDV